MMVAAALSHWLSFRSHSAPVFHFDFLEHSAVVAEGRDLVNRCDGDEKHGTNFNFQTHLP